MPPGVSASQVSAATIPSSRRITSEVIGGILGIGSGGIGGFLVGAGIGCLSGAGGYCGLLGILFTLPGAALGMTLGVHLGGAFSGGLAPFWAPLLGTAIGGVGSIAALGLAALAPGSTPIAVVAMVAAGTLPLVGAVIAYELVHRSRVTKAPSVSLVPMVTPEGGGLALAGRF